MNIEWIWSWSVCIFPPVKCLLRKKQLSFLPSCFWSTAALWFLEIQKLGLKCTEGHRMYFRQRQWRDGVCKDWQNHFCELAWWHADCSFISAVAYMEGLSSTTGGASKNFKTTGGTSQKSSMLDHRLGCVACLFVKRSRHGVCWRQLNTISTGRSPYAIAQPLNRNIQTGVNFGVESSTRWLTWLPSSCLILVAP